MPTPLDAELKLFELNRWTWALTATGKFKVIQDDTILDEFFDDWEGAFHAGVAKFGVGKPFLVKQIWVVEPVWEVYHCSGRAQTSSEVAAGKHRASGGQPAMRVVQGAFPVEADIPVEDRGAYSPNLRRPVQIGTAHVVSEQGTG